MRSYTVHTLDVSDEAPYESVSVFKSTNYPKNIDKFLARWRDGALRGESIPSDWRHEHRRALECLDVVTRPRYLQS